MVKVKLPYYKFWKLMRSVSDIVRKHGYFENTSCLVTPLANSYYKWIKDLYEDTKDKENVPTNIVTLRDMYYRSIDNN